MHVCRSFNVRHADSLPGLPARIPITSPRGILKVEEDRRKYIESIYAELNVAGEAMSSDAQRERVVEEARLAFAHNASVYVEQVASNWQNRHGTALLSTCSRNIPSVGFKISLLSSLETIQCVSLFINARRRFVFTIHAKAP